MKTKEKEKKFKLNELEKMINTYIINVFTKNTEKTTCGKRNKKEKKVKIGWIYVFFF